MITGKREVECFIFAFYYYCMLFPIPIMRVTPSGKILQKTVLCDKAV